MEAAAVAVVALVVGWVLGVATQFVSARFERTRRREERAEDAARELLGLFHQAWGAFRNAYRHDADVDRDENWRIVGQIRQKIAFLDDDARARLTLAADVLDDYWGAMQLTGATPGLIGFQVWTEARESLTAILRGMQLQPLRPEVDEYHRSMVEYRSMEEEAMRADAERRRGKKV